MVNSESHINKVPVRRMFVDMWDIYVIFLPSVECLMGYFIHLEGAIIIKIAAYEEK